MLPSKKLTKKDFYWVDWTVKDVREAAKRIEEELKRGYEKIKSIPKEERTFENTLIGDFDEKIMREWKYLMMYPDFHTEEKMREEMRKHIIHLHQVSIDLDSDKKLYEAYLEAIANLSIKELSPARQKFVKDVKRMIKHSGYHLPDKEYKKLGSLKKRLAALSEDFLTELNYSKTFKVKRSDLGGVSSEMVDTWPLDEKGKVVLSTDFAVFYSVMKFAENEKVRQKMKDLRSSLGGKKNISRFEKIIAIQAEIASLLGYSSANERALSERMAKKESIVNKFSRDIGKKVIAQAKKEVSILEDLKGSSLDYYDLTYYSERLKEKNFSINEDEIRQYFPLNHVRGQAFKLFEKLFGVVFKKAKLPVWHEDVEHYFAHDKKTGEVLGCVALDLFPREGKYKHEAGVYNIIRASISKKGLRNIPHSIYMGNLAKTNGKEKSLLPPRSVETFLHEFGHILHNMCSQVEIESQSGTRVARDFVETPSQMMEEFLYSDKGLKYFSSHYKTKKALPKKIRESILESRKHMKGWQTFRQVMYGRTDIYLYSNQYKGDQLDVEANLYKEYGFDPKSFISPKSVYPASFGHLVGGYNSGYYGYMWALVYAKDCFEEFKKEGIFSAKVGRRFRKEILEVGSSRDEMESLKAFLGRKPSNKAFLESLKPAKKVKIAKKKSKK